MKRDLYAFLKDRKIFTGGGHKTLREILSAKENQHLKKNDARYAKRKKGKK
jgi:hypothetical protein